MIIYYSYTASDGMQIFERKEVDSNLIINESTNSLDIQKVKNIIGEKRNVIVYNNETEFIKHQGN